MICTALPQAVAEGHAEQQKPNFLVPLFRNPLPIYPELNVRCGCACAWAYGSKEGIISCRHNGTVETVS